MTTRIPKLELECKQLEFGTMHARKEDEETNYT